MYRALCVKMINYPSLDVKNKQSLKNIFESDEPGGNRNRNMGVNAQHDIRKRAI
jgi:hypothetical protein